MSGQHRMTDVSAIVEFVFAGNARFTLVSQKTNTRFTYRARKSEPEGNRAPVWWISVLTGPDNDSSYSFLGTIFSRMSDYRHGHKAKLPPNDSRVVAFEWFYLSLQRGQLADKLEFWHEGRCGKCGRTLTVPSSIQTGFGPECVLTIKGRANAATPELPFPH
jgi:hypothetical protein